MRARSGVGSTEFRVQLQDGLVLMSHNNKNRREADP